jgi:hypothetical protein
MSVDREPSLQDIHLPASRVLDQEEAQSKEAAYHLHLPQPSIWPLLVSAAISVFMAGLLFISQYPWVALLAILFVLVSILGWALEVPGAQSMPESLLTYTPTMMVKAVPGETEEEMVYSVKGMKEVPTAPRNGLSRIRLLPF